MRSLLLLWTDFSTDTQPMQALCYLWCLWQLPSPFMVFSNMLYSERKAIARLAWAAFLQGYCLYQATTPLPLREELSCVIKKLIPTWT